MNSTSNNNLNTFLFYLFGILFWMSIIGFIPAVINILSNDGILHIWNMVFPTLLIFIVSIFFIFLKYYLFKATSNYRNTKLGIDNVYVYGIGKVFKYFILPIYILISLAVIYILTMQIMGFKL